MSADLIRCLRGLLGETLDLGCHYRESPARLTGARGFDRGVEREKVGLACNVADKLDDIANAGGVLEQALDRRIGAIGLRNGFLRDRGRLRDLTADFVDGTG